MSFHKHTESKSSGTHEDQIILIGNPNVGKSVIFNYLTGKYVTVSNYPGTTVEVSVGTLPVHGKKYRVLDTPGVNSLIPMSEDEKVTRDILLQEGRHTLVQVIDTKNIRRGLMISLELMEMELPFLMLLNMWDEAQECEIEINVENLSRTLGIRILKTVATRKEGLQKIKTHLHDLPVPAVTLHYPETIEKGIRELTPLLPSASISRRSLALMLLSGDESLSEWLCQRLPEEKIHQIEKIRQEVQTHLSEPVVYLINQTRLRQVEKLLSPVIRTREKPVRTFASFLGNLSIHPVWGVPILLFVLWITYELVGVFGAQTCVNFLENILFSRWLFPPLLQWIHRFLPVPLLQELLVGPYGIITMALTYAIAIVLPIVGCFFLIFGLMEDSGYLPRLAVMTHRFFKRMGLNGKAVLPMVLGLGCDTMATMTTRILETEKDRTIVTLLLALGVPCSAQLGVILGMFSRLPVFYLLAWMLMILGILLVVGYLASRVIPGEGSDFILEIPPLRIPQISNVAVKTLARIEWYLKEAVPLFILGTLILFILNKAGLLAILEKAAAPVIVSFLGLPAQATEAFLIGFLRRDYGAAGLLMLANEGRLNPHQILVSLVTITLFIPCIAQFFMMVKERGLKKALWIAAVVFPIAFGMGGLLNFVLNFLRI